jgi:hypothetical protein
LSKELIRLENEGMEDSDEYKNKFQELEKIYDYEVKGELMRLRIEDTLDASANKQLVDRYKNTNNREMFRVLEDSKGKN